VTIKGNLSFEGCTEVRCPLGYYPNNSRYCDGMCSIFGFSCRCFHCHLPSYPPSVLLFTPDNPPDINECALNGTICEYMCSNYIGGYQCNCPEGKTLAADNRTCGTLSSLFSSPFPLLTFCLTSFRNSPRRNLHAKGHWGSDSSSGNRVHYLHFAIFAFPEKIFKTGSFASRSEMVL
jgi:hypothetical protein